MTTSKVTKPIAIKGWIRVLVTVFGLITWIAGGVATFKVNNGAGSTTLILAGSFALLFAGAGRWPIKIVVGGNEIDLSHEVEEKIEGIEEKHQRELQSLVQIIDENVRVATTNKSSTGDLVKSLESLQAEVARKSGIEAIRAYDQKVRRFLVKNFPSSEIRSHKMLEYGRVDFELVLSQDISLFIETKYLVETGSRFVGKSLDSLIDQIPPYGRLLVIANVEDVEIAREKLQNALGKGRSEVIGWRGAKDDAQLLAAIKRLSTPHS